MLKKAIGIVTAVAVIVVIVFVALHHDRYRSWVFEADQTPVNQRTVVSSDTAAPAADALSERKVIDSAAVVGADSAGVTPVAPAVR